MHVSEGISKKRATKRWRATFVRKWCSRRLWIRCLEQLLNLCSFSFLHHVQVGDSSDFECQKKPMLLSLYYLTILWLMSLCVLARVRRNWKIEVQRSTEKMCNPLHELIGALKKAHRCPVVPGTGHGGHAVSCLRDHYNICRKDSVASLSVPLLPTSMLEYLEWICAGTQRFGRGLQMQRWVPTWLDLLATCVGFSLSRPLYSRIKGC